MSHLLKTAFPMITACLFLAGCVTTPPPSREDFMPTVGDYKEVASKTAGELITHEAITKFVPPHDAIPRPNGLPRVDIGVIRNATRDRVIIEQFAERAMEALLDSGQVTLVAHDRAAVEANGLDVFLADGKITLSDQADYYLEGAISRVESRAGGWLDVTYTFMLRLNDRNRSQLWKRNHDISKRGKDYKQRGGISVF